MKLTDAPFETIAVGGRCVSAIGTPGTISAFDPSDDGRRRGRISIAWKSGRVSHASVFLDGVPWLDKVEYLG